jgi:hypothetical protein
MVEMPTLIACAPCPRQPFAPFLPQPRQTRPAALSRPRCLTMARRSLAHNFQAVWYGAAIMALCWPATPSEVKFAADSLLEEAGFEPSVPAYGELRAPGARDPHAIVTSGTPRRNGLKPMIPPSQDRRLLSFAPTF